MRAFAGLLVRADFCGAVWNPLGLFYLLALYVRMAAAHPLAICELAIDK
jgi:hypothetical protein